MSLDAWTQADPTACAICGRDSCEDHLPADDERPIVEPACLRAVRAVDLLALPGPLAIIEGMAWAGCVSVLVSESGTGKTFVLLDQAAAVSDGLPWHGRATAHGSVVLISFESDALGPRLRALCEVTGRSLEHLYVVQAHDPISPRLTRDGEAPSLGERAVTDALVALARALAAANRPPIVLVILDTVRASLAGSEDNSEHVAAWIRAVRRLLARVPGAAAIAAHHAGWQDGEHHKKRERGSSAWRGNSDGTCYLEAGEHDTARDECLLTLRALKVRDGERPAPLHLIRRRVDLPARDAHAPSVTSCIIESDRRTQQDRADAQAAAADRACRADDVKTLRLIAERPDVATSQDRIRLALRARRDVAYASLDRLIQRGDVAPPERQRRPYTLTPAGRQTLREAGV